MGLFFCGGSCSYYPNVGERRPPFHHRGVKANDRLVSYVRLPTA